MAAELQDHEHGDLRWKVIATNNPHNHPERIALIDADALAGLIERAEKAEEILAAARRQHVAYRGVSDFDSCAYCSRLANIEVVWPCDTVKALHGGTCLE